MIPTAVVTSCSAAGWEGYGRTFVETYVRYWPKDIKLWLISEDALSGVPGSVNQVHLSGSEMAAGFLSRHRDDLRKQGRVQQSGDPGWTPKKISDGYNFRLDAYRFAKKVFAIEFASRIAADARRLFWVDADVVTFAPIEPYFLARMLPHLCAISCLDRGAYHSECGFVGYNLDHPQTKPFIREFARLYASDEVFTLQEWHDSWVFDWLRKRDKVATYNIPHRSRRHPFINSELSKFLDHAKGNRKQNGRSPKDERVIRDRIAYWN